MSAKKSKGEAAALAATLGDASVPWEERRAAAEGLGRLGPRAGAVGAEALLAVLETKIEFPKPQGEPDQREHVLLAKRQAANIATFLNEAAATAFGKFGGS